MKTLAKFVWKQAPKIGVGLLFCSFFVFLFAAALGQTNLLILAFVLAIAGDILFLTLLAINKML